MFTTLDKVFTSKWLVNLLYISILKTYSTGKTIKMEPVIIVHGGAGDIPDIRVPLKIAGVKESANIGYAILKNNGTALQAVEEAVKVMENEEAFNAGKHLS